MKEILIFIFLTLFWFTFIFLINMSIANANTPDWVLGKGHPSFPNSKYLIGVGLSEKSPITASESARAELIKNIRVKINSVLTDYISREKSVSESAIISETDFLLEGSQVKDGWYDEKHNVFYSFVVVERRYVLETLKTLIDNIQASVQLSLRQGDTFFNNGDIIKSLVYYYDGFKESSKLLPYIQTYNSVILANDRSEYKKEYNLLFKEKILHIIDNIDLEKSKSKMNGKDVDLGVRASFKGKGIKHFPIKFSSGYNRFSRKVTCNGDGYCEARPLLSKIVHVDDTRFVIKAVIDLITLEKHFNHSLDRELFGRLELLKVRFAYERELPEVKLPSEYLNLENDIEFDLEKLEEDSKDLPVVRYERPFKNDIDQSPLRNGSNLIVTPQRRGHFYMGYGWKNGNNINILKRW
jgi:hypothetical protein